MLDKHCMHLKHFAVSMRHRLGWLQCAGWSNPEVGSSSRFRVGIKMFQKFLLPLRNQPIGPTLKCVDLRYIPFSLILAIGWDPFRQGSQNTVSGLINIWPKTG